LDFDEELD